MSILVEILLNVLVWAFVGFFITLVFLTATGCTADDWDMAKKPFLIGAAMGPMAIFLPAVILLWVEYEISKDEREERRRKAKER